MNKSIYVGVCYLILLFSCAVFYFAGITDSILLANYNAFSIYHVAYGGLLLSFFYITAGYALFSGIYFVKKYFVTSRGGTVTSVGKRFVMIMAGLVIFIVLFLAALHGYLFGHYGLWGPGGLPLF